MSVFPKVLLLFYLKHGSEIVASVVSAIRSFESRSKFIGCWLGQRCTEVQDICLVVGLAVCLREKCWSPQVKEAWCHCPSLRPVAVARREIESSTYAVWLEIWTQYWPVVLNVFMDSLGSMDSASSVGGSAGASGQGSSKTSPNVKTSFKELSRAQADNMSKISQSCTGDLELQVMVLAKIEEVTMARQGNTRMKRRKTADLLSDGGKSGSDGVAVPEPPFINPELKLGKIPLQELLEALELDEINAAVASLLS
eukprot:6492266-Amphidinium_carterae.5